MNPSLNDLAAEIYGISRAKGFWLHPEPGNGASIDLMSVPRRNPGEVLMLIVTEVAEAMESIRDGDPLSEPMWIHSKPDGCTCAVDGPCSMPLDKPVGVPSEMADILIRVLDACAAWGIDIDTAVRAKIRYNATRERLHGRRL